MKNWEKIISQRTFRYMDQTTENVFNDEAYTALTSFAIDDTLAESVSDGLSAPTMRLWTHPETVVLGILDARLPYIEDGVRFLRENGFHVVVRNSGGLAVALDAGVLNISLVLPQVKHLSIYDCYEAMVSFVRYMLRDVTDTIEAYEIVGSYCPGDYDLSVDGKKFAGISQRRIKDGAAIQIYLDAEGNSKKRATFIRQFYDYSRKDAELKFSYPDVVPETMASLSDLLGQKISVADMKSRALSTLKELNETVVASPFSSHELEVFERRLEQMRKRNEGIAEMR